VSNEHVYNTVFHRLCTSKSYNYVPEYTRTLMIGAGFLVSNTNPNNPKHNIIDPVERHRNEGNLHLETAGDVSMYDNTLKIA
jgi:hypothetical protein